MRLTWIAAAACLSGCASGARLPPAPDVARMLDPDHFATDGPGQIEQSYRIGVGDKLALRVLQVEDLSFDEIVVDAAGNVQLPLVGPLRAAGLTPAELSTRVQQVLGERYLQNPQVVVTVAEAASQKITVDGAVTKPGVYEMRGRTTLMQAVAMAEGPTKIAQLDSVAVFRTVDGQRMVALFDLRAIRAGQAVDPIVIGDDVIVVDTSQLSANIREVLQALPGLAVFGYF